MALASKITSMVKKFQKNNISIVNNFFLLCEILPKNMNLYEFDFKHLMKIDANP